MSKVDAGHDTHASLETTQVSSPTSSKPSRSTEHPYPEHLRSPVPSMLLFEGHHLILYLGTHGNTTAGGDGGRERSLHFS